MPTATYEFERDMASTVGFVRTNSASEDAMKALAIWSSQFKRRTHAVISQVDDKLVATLCWVENDSNAAKQLDHACHATGVWRTLVGSETA